MDFLAMIFLMTIVINVRFMLDDGLCPYDGTRRYHTEVGDVDNHLIGTNSNYNC